MINNGLDLTPLDPDQDPEWRERLVQAVMTPVRNSVRAWPETRSTPAWSGGGLLSDLLAFTRPTLAVAFAAAAVTVVVSSIGTDGRVRRGELESPTVERYVVAEALGMPEALASWVEGGRAPSAGELLSALGGY